MWAERCLGETRELEDPAPALKELFVLPGEPRPQPHQLPKNPLSELPVVTCKVGQCPLSLKGWRARAWTQAGAAVTSWLWKAASVSWVLGQWSAEDVVACGRNDSPRSRAGGTATAANCLEVRRATVWLQGALASDDSSRSKA